MSPPTRTSRRNPPPLVASLTDSPDPVTAGRHRHPHRHRRLRRRAARSPASRFYRESNGVAGLQGRRRDAGDTLLATDTSGGDGYTRVASLTGLRRHVHLLRPRHRQRRCAEPGRDVHATRSRRPAEAPRRACRTCCRRPTRATPVPTTSPASTTARAGRCFSSPSPTRCRARPSRSWRTGAPIGVVVATARDHDRHHQRPHRPRGRRPVHHRQADRAGQDAVGRLGRLPLITVDTAAPALTRRRVPVPVQPAPAVVRLQRSVQTSLAAADLAVRNVATNGAVGFAGPGLRRRHERRHVHLRRGPAQRELRRHAGRGGRDGRRRQPAGRRPPLPFFSLTGDVNRDRRVDGSDFAILAGELRQVRPAVRRRATSTATGRSTGPTSPLLAGNFGKAVTAPVLVTARSVSAPTRRPRQPRRPRSHDHTRHRRRRERLATRPGKDGEASPGAAGRRTAGEAARAASGQAPPVAAASRLARH